MNIDNGKPLLKLEYDPLKIIYRLIFPYSFAVPIFYLMVFVWPWNKKPGLILGIYTFIIFILLIYSIVSIFDMLVTKNFILYSDRVEKDCRFIGKRIIFLRDARMCISMGIWKKICVFPKGNYFYRLLMRLTYHCGLGSKGSLEKFIDSCKSNGILFSRAGKFLLENK